MANPANRFGFMGNAANENATGPSRTPNRPGVYRVNTPNLPVVNAPNTGQSPNVNVPMPNVNRAQPNVNAAQPKVNVQQPNVNAVMPDANVANQPNMPNVSEETHPNANMANMPNMPNMPDMANMAEDKKKAEQPCSYKEGTLPSCAPLAMGFVPFQQENPPMYKVNEALTKGTLFPGLDMPWFNESNKSNPYEGTPLGELMALSFAIKELSLYLDTHKEDTEALDILKKLNNLYAEASEKFTKTYGPMTVTDITFGDTYTWVQDPWPWELGQRGGSR